MYNLSAFSPYLSLNPFSDVIHFLTLTPTSSNTRYAASLCLTFTLIVHGVFLKFGIRLINTLGLFKLVILGSMAGSGIMYLLGVPGFAPQEGYERPRNFEWEHFWEGSATGTNSLITALYNVIWCVHIPAHVSDTVRSFLGVFSDTRMPTMRFQRPAIQCEPSSVLHQLRCWR